MKCYILSKTWFPLDVFCGVCFNTKVLVLTLRVSNMRHYLLTNHLKLQQNVQTLHKNLDTLNEVNLFNIF